MTDLIETLYNYVGANRIGYTPEDIHQQSTIYSSLEQTEEEITNMLPPEARRQFEDYIRQRFYAQEFELECIFRAGLAIGLELSRL